MATAPETIHPLEPDDLYDRGLPVEGVSGPPGVVSYRVGTVDGAEFDVRLPRLDEVYEWEQASVVPAAPVRLNVPQTPEAGLARLDARELAQQECDKLDSDLRRTPGSSSCPQQVDHFQSSQGHPAEVWYVGTTELLATVGLGGWTLWLKGPRRQHSKTIVNSVTGSGGNSGFVKLDVRGTEVVLDQRFMGFTLRLRGPKGLRVEWISSCEGIQSVNLERYQAGETIWIDISDSSTSAVQAQFCRKGRLLAVTAHDRDAVGAVIGEMQITPASSS